MVESDDCVRVSTGNDITDFGLLSGDLALVTVGPEWALRFGAERDRISSVLGAAALDIQHIGSTAVTGILAKPILDVGVAIETFESGCALVPLLVQLGYAYRGENGIPRRHYFVLGHPVRTHHLHMLEAGSAQLIRHIRFRDILRRSPSTAARYSELKGEIASRVGGRRDQYQSAKSAFIESVLDRGPEQG